MKFRVEVRLTMQKKTLTLLASCLCGGFVASVADGADGKVPGILWGQALIKLHFRGGFTAV